MIAMTLQEIAHITGGRVHGDPDVVVTGAAYLDSRAPIPEGLFVAIVGERTDGHRFAADAHAVLGSAPTSAASVVVRDPVVALARLARHAVDTVRPTVLAVTGSHGKTGTKEHLVALLPGAVATPGNLNNELGVPLTCLTATRAAEHLILEMAARGVGQLSWLCEVAPPTVAAVLNVGSAHIGQFGSTELIAHAKGELVEALDAHGTAVLNADDRQTAAMVSRTVARVLTFGLAGEVSWRRVTLDDQGRASFELGYAGSWAPVRLPQVGAHHVANATAAAAMALAVGQPLSDLPDRLSRSPAFLPHRMQPRRRTDGLLILDDTYNANPESVSAALNALAAIGGPATGRTVAVLGEMCELGNRAEQAHHAVGDHAVQASIDLVVSVGARADGIALAAGGVAVADRDEALSWLTDALRPNDVVLIKASRAMHLDQLVEALLRREP